MLYRRHSRGRQPSDNLAALTREVEGIVLTEQINSHRRQRTSKSIVTCKLRLSSRFSREQSTRPEEEAPTDVFIHQILSNFMFCQQLHFVNKLFFINCKLMGTRCVPYSGFHSIWDIYVSSSDISSVHFPHVSEALAWGKELRGKWEYWTYF